MTSSTSNDPVIRETPLQEGLRRYAPKEAEGRRLAISEFLVSLITLGPRRPGSSS